MSDVIAPWLVSAKVSPPRQLVNTCRRELLLKRLLGNVMNPVTIVEAPAGFGKTLLLSQWREELKVKPCYVGWLSFDDSDDVDILLPYIAFAFQKAGLSMGETGLLSPSFHGARTAYSLGRLLNRIENCGEQCVLMLDDVERVSETVITDIIEPLIRLQPGNLHLVIACRQNPGISLSALSVQGSVTLLGPQEMRFNVDEIGALFGQTLDLKEVKTIYERTDGWPVAIQLLKSFIGDSDSLTNVLSGFTGTSKEAAEYFREQLLNSLTDNAHDFLQQTSVLDPISLDCANYIRHASDSQSLAQELHYLEGIFAPLEGHDETYRLHPLVREYLRETLKESSKETYKALCRSTASWLAEREQSLDAMRYAIQAQDIHLAGEIFERMRGGPQLWLLEGMSRLRTGMDLLAGHDIDGFPRIHLARGLVYAKDGQVKKARESFDKASLLSNGFAHDREGGDDTKLLIDRYILESLLTEYGCSPPTDALKADGLQFIQDNIKDEVSIHGYIMTLQCLVNMQSGQFDKCIRYGKAAIVDFREYGSRYGELFIYFHFGMSELARTNTQQALAQYEHAARMARMEFPGDNGLRRICDVALGEFYWETGDVGQARKHLKHVISGIQHPEAWFDIYMAWYQTTAEFLLYETGIDSAVMFLDKAGEHAREQELTRLEIFLDGLNASILHFSNQTATNLDYTVDIEGFLNDPRVQTTWREIEALSLAHARVALRNKDYGIATAKVDCLLNIAGDAGNHRLMTYGLVQQAIIEAEKGNSEYADKSMLEAIELGKKGFYIRPFLQETKSVYQLLKRIQGEREMDKKGTELINAVLESQDNTHVEEQSSSVFSSRELEILSELSKGQPDKLIARTLSLTPHGVRYHLKNIYSKMGVRNRTQAIAKASDLGLVS